MKATLTLNNKEYKVDVTKLIELGVIEDPDFHNSQEIASKIEWFEVGDVFKMNSGFVNVLIIEAAISASRENKYQIAGLDGLKVYSDFDRPVDFDTILRFLNDGGYEFVKNINKDVASLINSLLPPHKSPLQTEGQPAKPSSKEIPLPVTPAETQSLSSPSASPPNTPPSAPS
jgi:hypothetical protein